MKISNAKLLPIFNFFNALTFFNAIALLYFAKVTGSYTLALGLFSIAQLSKAFMEVPSGILSDKLGRKMCLQFGAASAFFSVLLYSLGINYYVMALGAVLYGISLACFSGNNDALLYESLAQEKNGDNYHEYLGKSRSTPELAWFLGAVVGGIFAQWSYSLIMWLSLIPQFIAVMLSFLFTEPTHVNSQEMHLWLHLKDALKLFKSNIKLRRLSVASILGGGIGESTWPLFSVFYKSLLPIWLVGFMVSLNYLISSVSYRLSGAIIRKHTPLKLLIFQEYYTRTINFIALFYPTFISPLLMALASIFYGPGEVAMNALQQNEFTDKQRATMSSLNSVAISLFYAIFAIILGYITDKIGVTKTLILVQFLLLPVLFIYRKIDKSTK